MQPKKLRNVAACSAMALGLAVGSARAVPVTGGYLEDPRCDPIPNQLLTHELGDFNTFPINESLLIFVSPAQSTVCVPDDGIANDWTVQIINTSSVAWTNLFFVADLGFNIGNADGSMADLILQPNVYTDAFRIDGTVTPGLNNTLQQESGVVDEILSPGESWRFNVSNFTGPPGGIFPPIIQTPGVFAASQPVIVPPINTASILATPVPEPGALGVFGLAAAALCLRRPRKARD